MTNDIPLLEELANLTGLQNLKDEKVSAWRIGLQGPPDSGKTTAAATFPHPIFYDRDHKLNTLVGSEHIHAIPAWSPEFVKQVLGKTTTPPNFRDAHKKWLRDKLPTIPEGYTFILDSWTSIQNDFDKQTDLEPVYTKKGEIDPRAFWNRKLKYGIELVSYLEAAKCNVIVTFHECIDRDDEGKPNGKLRPLMAGQFGDQLKGKFTDWYRQMCETDIDPKTREVKKEEYIWQIKGSRLADCGTSYVTDTHFIPANYQALLEVSGREK